MLRTLLIIILCSYLPSFATPYAQAQANTQSEMAALQDWGLTVQHIRHHNRDQAQQLAAVNNYINSYHWRSDEQRWQTRDHWSSSLDTIVSRQGDCEDLSIAKFATLLALGFNEQQLRLRYVYSKTLKLSHMVVSVRLDDGRELVLDSLHEELKPLAARTDLETIYHFNRSGIWIPKLSRHQRSLQLLPRWRKILANDPMLQQPQLTWMQLASL